MMPLERSRASYVPSPRVDPSSRLQFLPGVGPARARLFERLGLSTLEHLVRHYPRAYLDARRCVQVSELAPGERMTVPGVVRHAAALRTRGGRTDSVVSLARASGTLPRRLPGPPFRAR